MKDFFVLLQALWRMMTPPPADADGNRVRRWRVVVQVVTMSNAFGTVAFVMLAIGAVPAVTLGFAPAVKLDGMQSQIDAGKETQRQQFAQLQQNQLDQQIMATRTRQCEAMKQRDKGVPDADQALRFATDRLQEKLDAYFHLTNGRAYRLPDCSEV